ncbi:hypothetical protein HD554DRAFT_2115574 [Boletus coccyginus]|nr:hypothetical protein HD554DRAFT_2115574 [Boletus coccyginus]
MAFNAMAVAAAHESAQQLWAAWYIWIGNPIIATSLMSFLIHELQSNKIPTAAEQWECTKQVLFSHFTIELPAIWLFHPMAEMFGMQTYQTTLPQVAIFFVFEDMFHYFAHQALHWGPLYKHIHKLHHKYSAPFGLADEYAHPAEVFILGTGTIAGSILYCYFTQNLHILTVYIWITLCLFQAIDAHSGYDFPWSLQHIVPFWLGAEHHDFHHMVFTNNYSISFWWCNRLFGTDDKYCNYCQHIAASKVAMKGKSKAKQEAAERQLIAKIKAEGQHTGGITEGSVLDKTVK